MPRLRFLSFPLIPRRSFFFLQRRNFCDRREAQSARAILARRVRGGGGACAQVRACGVWRRPSGAQQGEARALRCCRSFFFFVGVVCTCAPLPTRRRGASVRARPHGALAQRLRSLESEGCAARGTPARARAASPPKRAASRFPGCYWRPLARVGAAPPALAFPARGGGDDNSRQILAARSPQARARAAAGPPNATRAQSRLAFPARLRCHSKLNSTRGAPLRRHAQGATWRARGGEGGCQERTGTPPRPRCAGLRAPQRHLL